MCLTSRVRREDRHHARGLGSQTGIGARNWSDTVAIMPDRSRAPITAGQWQVRRSGTAHAHGRSWACSGSSEIHFPRAGPRARSGVVPVLGGPINEYEPRPKTAGHTSCASSGTPQPQRRRVRLPRWHLPNTSQQRTHRAPPPQPRRRPRPQPRHPHHRHRQDARLPHHPGRHRPPHRRRQDHPRDQTLPQAIHQRELYRTLTATMTLTTNNPVIA